MEPDLSYIKIPIQEIKEQEAYDKKVSLWVARLDLIHPVVSGNKLFKLYHFIEKAIAGKNNTLLTYGGMHSNHLVATAWMGMNNGFKTIGIVRGRDENHFSETLNKCREYGMDLKFFSAEEFKKLNDGETPPGSLFNISSCTVIPAGGYHPLGARGASLIPEKINSVHATHICTAIGTATTFAGLIANARAEVIGIPVLRNLTDIDSRVRYLLEGMVPRPYVTWENYHFGGYAKKTRELLSFMNDLYTRHGIPTDFVYTAKMMWAVYEKLRCNYFEPGSVVVCLHTGGLQGNSSLPAGSLVF